ncbi:MAG: leucyl/phenylalanyl-tRNA--protein transferase [Planctomycetia bacterium]|nr:leucyl/phenylalanyl-tRNA--protein transferase [Planctomycetia bacterium]
MSHFLSVDLTFFALCQGVFPWTEPELLPILIETQDYVVSAEELLLCRSLTEKNIASLPEKSRNARWQTYDISSLDTLADLDALVEWWSPNPRAIFDLDNIHIPRRLLRDMKSQKFIVTYDQAFPEVMLACANVGFRRLEGTWITREFFSTYCKLHELGFAHSVECWQEKEPHGRELVGGVYGVAIGRFFDGESMFSSVSNASKVALFTLLLRLKECGFQLFDLQVLNPHTQSLGGIDIPRSEYLARLNEAIEFKNYFHVD